jgi:hypothetical protein
MSSYPMQDPSQVPWPARVDQQQPPQPQQMPQAAPPPQQAQATPQQAPQQQPNPSVQDPSQLLGRLQQIAQTPMQPVPQAGPDQGASPVKRFLTNFMYGAGQAALQHVGLPTDYDKQQAVIQHNDRQQQLNQQAQETSSLIGMHYQQTQDAQRAAAKDQYSSELIPAGAIGTLLGIDPTTVAPRGVWMDALYKHLTTPPKERTPLSTSTGYYNVDASGHATPILGPGNVPLMASKQDKPDTPEQQSIDEYQRLHPGSSLNDALRNYANVTQKIPIPAAPMMMVPNNDGTSTATLVHPGMKVGMGAESTSQFGQEPGKIQKLVQPYDDLVSAADQAHQYAVQNTAPGDAALLLKYVDAVKPTKGFRLTNTELNMFSHTRGMLGDVQALGQKLDNGQMLTPDQKRNMLAIVDLSAAHAKQMKASLMQKYSQYANPGGIDAPPPAAQPGSGGADPFSAFGGKKR